MYVNVHMHLQVGVGLGEGLVVMVQTPGWRGTVRLGNITTPHSTPRCI